MATTEQQWLRQQEKLDRSEAIEDRRELLDDEFDRSPLDRLTLQRLRNAHDEGRTLAFRSEFGRGCCCIAQAERRQPAVICREFDPVKFRQMREWIKAEWKRLKGNENRTGNNATRGLLRHGT